MAWMLSHSTPKHFLPCMTLLETDSSTKRYAWYGSHILTYTFYISYIILVPSRQSDISIQELEALFVKQAERIHGGSDVQEQIAVNEEIARMREHVLNESDSDKVRLFDG